MHRYRRFHSLGQRVRRLFDSPAGARAHTGAVEALEQRIAPANFLVINVADSGSGSLRQAIEDANATPNVSGPDTITFNIPGAAASVRTIAPQSPLPTITDAVVIDGYSQPGALVNTLAVGNDAVPLIELKGNGGSFSGLEITAGGSVVKGLVINAFGTAGLMLTGTTGGNTISGNFIGTDASGTAAVGNRDFGIFISSPGNHLGGTASEDRNVISGTTSTVVNFGIGILVQDAAGNVFENNYIGTNAAGTAALGNSLGGLRIVNSPNNHIGGVAPGAGNVISGNSSNYNLEIVGATASGNVVEGNFIGTDATGTNSITGGTTVGIDLLAPNNIVGGTSTGARNVISGNGAFGISMYDFGTSTASSNVIQGNYIGVDSSGTVGVPNSLNGIQIDGQGSNVVGGSNAAEANVIAFNLGDGVRVIGGSGNSVRGNSIHSNTGLGINLGGDGVTANDAGDSDTGVNALQNFPVITSAVRNGTTVTINATLNSMANRSFTIDFYVSAAADASGFGEGAVYLGSKPAMTDASGNVSVSLDGTLQLRSGGIITATATDAAGNTSEFSAAALAGTVFVWDGSDSGDWFTAANWTPDGVPGPDDMAILNSVAVGNFPALVGNATVGSYQQTTGFLQGNGTLTINDSFVWSGGTMQGGGTTTVAATGTFAWSPGTRLFGRTLINAGIGTVIGSGDIVLDVGSQFINSGTLTDSANAFLRTNVNPTATFTNTATGVFVKNGTTGTTTIGIPMTNAGALDVMTGNLRITQGPFAHTGIASVAGGAALEIQAFGGSTGDFALNAANAELRFISTNVFLLDNGTDITGPGLVRLAGNPHVDVGDAASDVINIQNLSLAGGSSGDRLGGAGTLNILGIFDWQSASHSGTGTTNILPGATLNVIGSGFGGLALTGRTLNNQGTVNFPGSIDVSSGVTINNSGLWEFPNIGGGLASSDPAIDTFNNLPSGIVRLAGGGSGSAYIYVDDFSNAGHVDVLSGDLSVRSGSATGTFNVSPGATLFLASNNSSVFTLNGNITLGGGGRYETGSGSLVIAGTTTVAAGTTFRLDNIGDVDGAGSFVVNGAMEWIGGAMRGTGTTTIAAGATLNMLLDDDVTLDQRSLNLAGTTTFDDNDGLPFPNQQRRNDQKQRPLRHRRRWRNDRRGWWGKFRESRQRHPAEIGRRGRAHLRKRCGFFQRRHRAGPGGRTRI
jgi:hypothetical protein